MITKKRVDKGNSSFVRSNPSDSNSSNSSNVGNSSNGSAHSASFDSSSNNNSISRKGIFPSSYENDAMWVVIDFGNTERISYLICVSRTYLEARSHQNKDFTKVLVVQEKVKTVKYLSFLNAQYEDFTSMVQTIDSIVGR